MKIMQGIQKRAQTASLYIFYGLLAYVPLHIFLSTWLGTTFGMLEVAKVLKDVVLVIGFGLVVMASLSKPWFAQLFRSPLLWLIALYGLLTLALGITSSTDPRAETLGIVYNLRFFLFFIYALLLAKLYDPVSIRRKAIKIVLAIGILVSLFGVIQYTVLPDQALTHVGYSRENGVLPAFFIDDKLDLERAMSTIRDPNTLGSYLIIIIALLVAAVLAVRSKDLRRIAVGGLLLAGLALLFTFSRSSWIGALAALLVFGLIYIAHKYEVGKFLRQHKLYVVLAAVAIAIFGAGLFVARDSYVVQNVIFHADESTELEDPNELRLRFWQESLDTAAENPLGHGPGTAGLASIQSDEVVLNENYYLQILHEVGIIGLALFLTILVIVALKLYGYYRSERNIFALALFAAFIGLSITNFLVHIWANEAVAYTFWGLAGLYVTVLAPKK